MFPTIDPTLYGTTLPYKDITMQTPWQTPWQAPWTTWQNYQRFIPPFLAQSMGQTTPFSGFGFPGYNVPPVTPPFFNPLFGMGNPFLGMGNSFFGWNRHLPF